MFSLSLSFPLPHLFFSLRLHRKTQVQSILHQRMLYNIIARLEKKRSLLFTFQITGKRFHTQKTHNTHITCVRVRSSHTNLHYDDLVSLIWIRMERASKTIIT